MPLIDKLHSSPSRGVMPGTKVINRSRRFLAPDAFIMSSVISVTGTGDSSMLSACCEAVVMVADLPRFMLSMRSMKRRGSERVGVKYGFSFSKREA